jgi:hypothetical protein
VIDKLLYMTCTKIKLALSSSSFFVFQFLARMDVRAVKEFNVANSKEH